MSVIREETPKGFTMPAVRAVTAADTDYLVR